MTVRTGTSLTDLPAHALKQLVEDIPALPAIFQHLFAKMQDPGVGVPEIARIISLDQALALKVLALVNRAHYGISRQIKTVSRAVVILGFQAVRGAAMAISVFDFFGDEDSTEEMEMSRFWEHSIAVAATSRVLADIYQRKIRDDAFVVGLLHDVGRLVQKRYLANDFHEAMTAARELHVSRHDCEQQVFNLDHARIGGLLFEQWNFPESVVEGVRYHHEPADARAHSQLAAVVHLADIVSCRLGYGAPGAFPPEECDEAALKLLDIEFEDLEMHHDRIREDIVQSLKILQLLQLD